MTPVVLHHCQPVEILVFATPTDLSLSLVVGGVPGDGSVSVTATPSAPPGPPTIPAAGSGVIPIVGALIVTLHYAKADGGPDTIDASYAY